MSVWRIFKFFQSDTVKGPLETLEITAACCGRNSLVFGDSDGTIRIFDHAGRTLQLEFAAFAGPVSHIKHLRSRNILVTLGDDDTMNTCVLRVWDLDKRDASGRPAQREHRIFSAKYPAPQETVPLRCNYNSEITKKIKFFGKSVEGLSDAAARAQGGIAMSEFKTCAVSFDVTEDLQHCAIGLANREVVLIRGDLERERSPKVRRIRSSIATKPLTFVGFPRAAKMETVTAANRLLGLLGSGGGGGGSSSAAQLLYTVHEDWVTIWRLTAKNDPQEFPCEPQMGAIRDCAALNDEGQLVVGSSTTNQVAIFGDESLLAELATNFDPARLTAMHYAEVDGDKRKVLFHKHYIVVLTQNDSRPDRFTLQAYDLENAIRALHKQQEGYVNVGWVLSDTSQLLVITQEPKVDVVQQKIVRLTEEETQAKLEQLFTKECYDIAKKMAKKFSQSAGGAGGDATQHMNIAKKYGDHLYAKGKFSEAIDQYIEAIGQLEPSYVIRQFLDAQRIHHLTRYLEELHHTKHHDVANRNHTTLLLNCYTKLRDEQKLNAFIHRDDIRFDPHNAIKVCRQAGYFEEATYLAERYQQPSDYVKIQLENLGQPLKALQFIRSLSVDVAEAILKEHGKELVLLIPDDATDTLTELCTTWRGPPRKSNRSAAVGAPAGANADAHQQQGHDYSHHHLRRTYGQTADMPAPSKPAKRANAHDLIHVFVDSPLCLLRFLRSVVDSGDADTPDDPEGQQVVYNTLLELYLTKDLKRSTKHLNPSGGVGATTGHGSSTTVSPSLAGTVGTGTVSSLSGGAAAAPPSQRVQMEAAAEPYAKRLEHAMSLLEQHQGKYDDYHALALVQQHHFEQGILFMLERLELFTEIFTHFSTQFQTAPDLATRSRAKERLIRTCEASQKRVAATAGEGAEDAEREMWISLLSLLARSRDNVADDIARVLEHIETRDLLPAVAVIEILSVNKDLTLRTVREYILRMLLKESSQIEVHQREIKEYTDKTAKLKSDIKDLQTSATLFQSNKCAHCNSHLDLPAVHFICKHSFHQRCLNDVLECNLCSAENRKTLQLQRELDDAANNSVEFFRALGDSADGTAVVAQYFGQGIFGAPKLRKGAVLMAGAATFDDTEDTDGQPDQQNNVEELEDEDDQEYFQDELENPEEVELW